MRGLVATRPSPRNRGPATQQRQSRKENTMSPVNYRVDIERIRARLIDANLALVNATTALEDANARARAADFPGPVTRELATIAAGIQSLAEVLADRIDAMTPNP